MLLARSNQVRTKGLGLSGHGNGQGCITDVFLQGGGRVLLQLSVHPVAAAEGRRGSGGRQRPLSTRHSRRSRRGASGRGAEGEHAMDHGAAERAGGIGACARAHGGFGDAAMASAATAAADRNGRRRRCWVEADLNRLLTEVRRGGGGGGRSVGEGGVKCWRILDDSESHREEPPVSSPSSSPSSSFPPSSSFSSFSSFAASSSSPSFASSESSPRSRTSRHLSIHSSHRSFTRGVAAEEERARNRARLLRQRYMFRRSGNRTLTAPSAAWPSSDPFSVTLGGGYQRQQTKPTSSSSSGGSNSCGDDGSTYCAAAGLVAGGPALTADPTDPSNSATGTRAILGLWETYLSGDGFGDGEERKEGEKGGEEKWEGIESKVGGDVGEEAVYGVGFETFGGVTVTSTAVANVGELTPTSRRGRATVNRQRQHLRLGSVSQCSEGIVVTSNLHSPHPTLDVWHSASGLRVGCCDIDARLGGTTTKAFRASLGAVSATAIDVPAGLLVVGRGSFLQVWHRPNVVLAQGGVGGVGGGVGGVGDHGTSISPPRSRYTKAYELHYGGKGHRGGEKGGGRPSQEEQQKCAAMRRTRNAEKSKAKKAKKALRREEDRARYKAECEQWRQWCETRSLRTAERERRKWGKEETPPCKKPLLVPCGETKTSGDEQQMLPALQRRGKRGGRKEQAERRERAGGSGGNGDDGGDSGSD